MGHFKVFVLCLIMVLISGLMGVPLNSFGQESESMNVRMDPQWVKTYEAGGFSWAYDIVADKDGNTYSTGYFQRNLKISAGKWIEPKSVCHSSCPDTYFLMKHDAEGNFLWIRYGIGRSRPARLALDKHGDVWVAGNDYGSETGFTTSDGPEIRLKKEVSASTGAFALRYNPDGDLLNAFMIPGGENFDVNDLTIDQAGNFIVAGSYQFRNHEKKYEVRRSFLLMKFKPDFSLVWELRGDTIGQSNLQGVCVDRQGNVFATGGYNHQFRLSNKTLKTSGHDAIAIAFKISPKGKMLWIRDSLGSFTRGAGRGIVCDEHGDVFLMTNTPYSINLISKFHRNGSLIWSHTVKGKSSNYFEKLLIDRNGNLYLCGFGYGTSFSTTEGESLTYRSVGGTDPFIVCYNSQGELQWLRAFGGKGTDYLKAIAISEGKLHAFGWFGGAMSFRDTVLSSGSGYVFWQAKFDLGLMSRMDLSPPVPAVVTAVPDTVFDMQNCTCARKHEARTTVFFPSMESLLSYDQFRQLTLWRSTAPEYSFRSLFYRNFQFSTGHQSGFYSLIAIGFRKPITFEHPNRSFAINLTPCTHNLHRYEVPLTVFIEHRTSFSESDDEDETAEQSTEIVERTIDLRANFSARYIGIELSHDLIRPWNKRTGLPVTDSTGLQIPYTVLVETPRGFTFASNAGLRIETGSVCAPLAEITHTGCLFSFSTLELVTEATTAPLFNYPDYPFFNIDQRWRYTDASYPDHDAAKYDTLLTRFTGLFISEAHFEIPVRDQMVQGVGQNILLNNHFVSGIILLPGKVQDELFPGGPLSVALKTEAGSLTVTLQELAAIFYGMGFQDILIHPGKEDIVVQFRKMKR